VTDGRPHEQRRGVTRGYVGGLIAAITALAVAVIIASWGMISYLGGVEPITSAGVSAMAGEILVAGAIILLVIGLWRQAVVLLRGRRTPPWAHTIVIAFGAYLIWSLGGLGFGLGISETWLSPFAFVLLVVWLLASLAFWSVLARRVFTDRPVPTWPWEKRDGDDPGPDWAHRDPGDDGGTS